MASTAVLTGKSPFAVSMLRTHELNVVMISHFSASKKGTHEFKVWSLGVERAGPSVAVARNQHCLGDKQPAFGALCVRNTWAPFHTRACALLAVPQVTVPCTTHVRSTAWGAVGKNRCLRGWGAQCSLRDDGAKNCLPFSRPAFSIFRDQVLILWLRLVPHDQQECAEPSDRSNAR